MDHAIIVNGEPVVIARTTFVQDEVQYSPGTLDLMSRDQKAELGLFEVETVTLGSGPVLESGPVYSVDGDHVVATFTYRERNPQEAEQHLTNRTESFTTTDIAKVSYAQFLGLFAVAKQVIPSITPGQFSTALDAQLANPAFTYAQFTAWVRARL